MVLAAADDAAYAPKDALAAALALEGLLFVSFTLAFSLAKASDGGRHPFFAQGGFGRLVVVAIAFAALAAGAAWWDIYAAGDDVQGGISTFFQGVGLAVGIIVQPIFAAIINVQAGD